MDRWWSEYSRSTLNAFQTPLPEGEGQDVVGEVANPLGAEIKLGQFGTGSGIALIAGFQVEGFPVLG